MADNEEALPADASVPETKDFPPEPPNEAPQGEGEEAAEGAEGGESAPKEAQKLRLDDFVFPDEKKKKKKKEKPKPVKRPTRQEYETTLTELNRTLAKLRKKVFDLDEINLKRTAEIVEIEEDHQEVYEHLSRVHKKQMETLTMEQEYNAEIIRKQKELDEECEKKIAMLQDQYNKTYAQFAGEIDMLSTKLSTLRSFSDGRNEMLEKISNMQKKYKEGDRMHQDRLYSMQQRAVVERNRLDEEAKARFERIVDDFTNSREVRNAAYTRRLLSENSQLRRQYNKLIPINLAKEKELNRLLEKTADTKETHAALSDMIKQLEKAQEKRAELLAKLRKQYVYYRLKIVKASKYHRIFEALKKHEEKELEKLQDPTMLFLDLEDYAERLFEKYRELKHAEREYMYTRLQYDQFVEGVKLATFSLCDLVEYDAYFPKTFDEYVVKRNGILKGLVDLVTITERPLRSEAMLKAEYYTGYLGLLPLDQMICKVCNCKGCDGSTASALKWTPSFCTRYDLLEEKDKDEDNNKIVEQISDPAMMCR